jgi:hypothetical protein
VTNVLMKTGVSGLSSWSPRRTLWCLGFAEHGRELFEFLSRELLEQCGWPADDLAGDIHRVLPGAGHGHELAASAVGFWGPDNQSSRFEFVHDQGDVGSVGTCGVCEVTQAERRP